MHPDAAKELVHIEDLVNAGKLPETAIPRLFYMGHEVLYGHHVDDRKYQCASCGHGFQNIEYDDEAKTCNELCCENPEIYDVTEDGLTHWRCVDCKHEWDSTDGTFCSSCGRVKES